MELLGCSITLDHISYSAKPTLPGLSTTYGMINDPDNPKSGGHRECERSHMTRMENAVQAVITAVRSGFKRDPFDLENGLDKQRLYPIHPGRPVPEEAQVVVLRSDALGAELKEAFVEKCRNWEKLTTLILLIEQSYLRWSMVTKKSQSPLLKGR